MSTPPAPALQASPPDPRLELAYEAGVNALNQQDTTLGNLRNRATGLLSAAALVTSFSAGLGLIRTDKAKGSALSDPAAWLLLAILVAIGGFSMFVLWPVRDWVFGPDVRLILQRIDRGSGVDEIRRYVADAMVGGRQDNAEQLVRRLLAYRVGVGLLILEVVVLVGSLVLNR